jgi:hypothetical protein
MEMYSFFFWLFTHIRINSCVLSDGVTDLRKQQCADFHFFKGSVMGRHSQCLKNTGFGFPALTTQQCSLQQLTSAVVGHGAIH